MPILNESKIYQEHLTFGDGDSQYAIYATCVDLLAFDQLDSRHKSLLAHIKTNHRKAYSDAVETCFYEAWNI